MPLQVKPLNNVGIEVSGFDINQPMTEAIKNELISLWNEHAIMVFRNQDISPEKQIAFSRLFGELEMHPLKATTSDEYPELFMLSNDPVKEKFMTANIRELEFVNREDYYAPLKSVVQKFPGVARGFQSYKNNCQFCKFNC